jgi:hypothetical protein
VGEFFLTFWERRNKLGAKITVGQSDDLENPLAQREFVPVQ